MVCNICKLNTCTCFVEDVPDPPFYLTKYCVYGPKYTIYVGAEHPKRKDLYELFAEKWYDTKDDAIAARRKMISKEISHLEARLRWLNGVLND